MSQYIVFYLRDGNNFYELDAYGRNSCLFRCLNEFAPYERISPLTNELIASALKELEGQKKDIKRSIEKEEQKITAINSFQNTASEKLDLIDECQDIISDLKEELDSLSSQSYVLHFLDGINDNYQYMDNHGDYNRLYFGIESPECPTLDDVVE